MRQKLCLPIDFYGFVAMTNSSTTLNGVSMMKAFLTLTTTLTRAIFDPLYVLTSITEKQNSIIDSL